MPITGAGSTPEINFFKLRDQLEQAAELASTGGKINANKLPKEFRSFVGTEQSLDAFKQKLQQSLVDLDRFDVGVNGGRAVPATGGCGGQTFDEERISNFRQKSDPPPPHVGFIGRLMGLAQGASNIQLDPNERAKLMESGSAGAKALVEIAEGQASQSPEAAKAFLPDLSKHQLSTIGQPGSTDKAFITGDAGSTKDLEAVKAKNLKTGEWFSVAPEADGRYILPIGKLNGDLGLWFQPKGDVPPIFAGTVNTFYFSGGNHESALTNWIGNDGVVGKLTPTRF
jgi:hypothetical protein